MEQNQPMNMEPTPPPTANVAPAPKPGSSMGIAVGLIIIIGVIVVGAYYVWTERMHERVVTDEDLQALISQSISTEPEAIEADLVAETPDEFDAELDAAFSELDAAFNLQ